MAVIPQNRALLLRPTDDVATLHLTTTIVAVDTNDPAHGLLFAKMQSPQVQVVSITKKENGVHHLRDHVSTQGRKVLGLEGRDHCPINIGIGEMMGEDREDMEIGMARGMKMMAG